MACKGRFARAVCPEYRNKLPRPDGERDTAQRLVPLALTALVNVGDVIELKKFLCHSSL